MKLQGKRIVIFIWQDWLHPKAGGAEYYCRCLCQILVKHGAAVTIVSCRSDSNERLIKKDGLQIHRIASRVFVLPATILWYLQHRNNFDLVIDFTNKIPYLTPLYVRQPLIAAFMHTNGVTFLDEWGPLGFIGQAIENTLLLPYLKTPAVAISQSTKDELLGRGFLSVDVGIVPITWSKPKPAKPDKKPRLVVVSRLRKYKRLDLLIRAVAIIVKTTPNLHVDIIGRGPDEKRLKDLAHELGISKSITFHGYVEDMLRDELLAKAWLTTITSRKEGWGITVSEAAQFAAPAIGVDAPGTRDAIIDTKTGRILTDDSPATLAEAIIEFIDQPALRLRLGRAAQEFALTHTVDRLEVTWLTEIEKAIRKT